MMCISLCAQANGGEPGIPVYVTDTGRFVYSSNEYCV